MSATVSNFGDASRRKKAEAVADSNFACPHCGGKRFMATVFVQRQRGRNEPGDVVGYLHPLRCVQCGSAVGEDGA